MHNELSRFIVINDTQKIQRRTSKDLQEEEEYIYQQGPGYTLITSNPLKHQ